MNSRCDPRGEAANGTSVLPSPPPDAGSCLFLSLLPYDAMVEVLICVFVVLTLLALVLNVFTLYSLGSSEDLSWEPRFILLKNLILCDVLQTIISGPAVTVALALRRTVTFNALCLTQYFLGTTCILCSLITVTFMALERYLYVCHAIRYLVILTKLRLRLAIALTWATALAVSSTSLSLLHLGRAEPRDATLGLLCEPDTVEQHMGFPRAAAVFRKLVGGTVLLLCLSVYTVTYLRMYQDARDAVVPFNLVNTRARRTLLFYCGMLLLQLLPVFAKVASDAVWELAGTGTMLAEEGPSLRAGMLHMALLVLVLVPPCINPLIYGLKNREVRRALGLWCRKEEWLLELEDCWVRAHLGGRQVGGRGEAGRAAGGGEWVAPSVLVYSVPGRSSGSGPGND